MMLLKLTGKFNGGSPVLLVVGVLGVPLVKAAWSSRMPTLKTVITFQQ